MSVAAVSTIPGDEYARYHTFWQRFVASLLDGMVLMPVYLPGSILAGYAPSGIAIAWFVATFPVGWLYTSYCHGRWGQTLGKRAAGVKVVRVEDELPIGYGRAFRRDAGTILASALSCAVMVMLILRGDTESFRMFDHYGTQSQTASESLHQSFAAYNPWTLLIMALSWSWSLAEFVTMLSNPRRRAIHDWIGGTVVVLAPKQAAAAPPPPPGNAGNESRGW